MKFRDNQRFAYIFIHSCQWDQFWYANLVGTEKLALLRGYEARDGTYRILEFCNFEPLGGKRYEVKQSYHPKDITLI